MRRTDPASTCPLHRSKTEGVVSLAKRPWTEEDNARLKEFVVQGASIIRAAAALHRNIQSVRTQARKLGAPLPPMRVFRKKVANVTSGPCRHYYLELISVILRGQKLIRGGSDRA